MSRLEDALSTATVFIVAVIVCAACAYVRGYADGGSLRLRSTCNLETVNGLKPSWYTVEVRDAR